MLNFGSKVNRSYSLYLKFLEDYITVTAFFNKTNTFIGFTTDHKISNLCKEDKVKSHIYTDLKQSSFATTFLDIKDFKSNNLDIRCQFSNVLEKYRDRITYVANESVKLAKYPNPSHPEKSLESSVYFYVLTFSDYSDEFLYVLVERQHIDISLAKKLVRTSSIQIATPDCLEDLSKMVSHFNGKSDSNLNIDHIDADKALKDLFPSEEPINIRRID